MQGWSTTHHPCRRGGQQGLRGQKQGLDGKWLDSCPGPALSGPGPEESLSQGQASQGSGAKHATVGDNTDSGDRLFRFKFWLCHYWLCLAGELLIILQDPTQNITSLGQVSHPFLQPLKAVAFHLWPVDLSTSPTGLGVP